MMKAWEKNIRKVVPYVPGEQPNKERMIKLNTKNLHLPTLLYVSVHLLFLSFLSVKSLFSPLTQMGIPHTTS